MVMVPSEHGCADLSAARIRSGPLRGSYRWASTPRPATTQRRSADALATHGLEQPVRPVRRHRGTAQGPRRARRGAGEARPAGATPRAGRAGRLGRRGLAGSERRRRSGDGSAAWASSTTATSRCSADGRGGVLPAVACARASACRCSRPWPPARRSSPPPAPRWRRSPRESRCWCPVGDAGPSRTPWPTCSTTPSSAARCAPRDGAGRGPTRWQQRRSGVLDVYREVL